MNNNRRLIKRFISYYKPYRVLFVIDLVVAFAMSAIELVYPRITTKIIDQLIPNMMINDIVKSVIVLLVLYIFAAGCAYYMHYMGHKIGVMMEADMRNDLFRHMQKLPFKFYDNRRTGKLMSRVVNDLNDVSELAHHGPEDLFISIVMFIGSFIVLFKQEPRLALPIYLIIIPLIIVFTIKTRRNISKSFKEVREKTADINAQLENSISGIRVAKSYANEEHEMKKFRSGNNAFRNSKTGAFKALANFATGMGFFINLLNVLVLGFGGFFAYKGIITIGELAGFLLYMTLMTQPIRRLTNFTQQYEQGLTGFVRFDEIMNFDPEDDKGTIKLEKAKGEIQFDDVTFHYNDDEIVLDNISLDIKSATTVALVGPSGGGKTTLCHLIPNFYEIQGGEIRIDGKNIKDYTQKSLRQNIGLVQQDVFLFTGSIRDNIRYGKPDATNEEIQKAAYSANIHEFIESLPDGYETYIGEKGIRLSGGQKQRISIARAFLKNPPILILDEATSALDNETEQAIQRSLEELLQGRTTIVIAHRLSTIRNADEIVVLTAEGIKEKGSHEKLYAMDGGIYKRLYDAQFTLEESTAIQNDLNG